MISDKLIEEIRNKMIQVVEKHPDFVQLGNLYQGVSILSEELGEVAKSLSDDSFREVKEELIDVIIASIRFYELLDKKEEESRIRFEKFMKNNR